MGSVLSKNDACVVWCGNVDDAYPEQGPIHTTPVLENDDTTVSLAGQDVAFESSTHKLAAGPISEQQQCRHVAEELAPSTSEHLQNAARYVEHDLLLSRHHLDHVEEKLLKSIGSGSRQVPTPYAAELLTPPTITRALLMQTSPEDAKADGEAEGLNGFFHSDGDELVEDIGWSTPKRGPSLAELLRRVEYLGNVDLALSEVRSSQDGEDQGEAMIRRTVLERFLLVMGPGGPGLVVKKCHRSKGFGTGGSERGKWAARTIRFEPNGTDCLPDGTPLGGTIVWNSKRLFPREQRGVNIAEITKVEHSGKSVWMTATGESRLGFETTSNLDARFLCRSIDFLVSAAAEHHNVVDDTGRTDSKASSLTSTGTDLDTYAALDELLSGG